MAQRLVVELPRGSCRGTEEHDRQREASKARGECAAEAVRLTRRLERCGGEPVGATRWRDMGSLVEDEVVLEGYGELLSKR
uniref:Uncharacterized protein n=1 Tax=Oryza sativa subsp. japonica TaxID=39947 RepID=Q6ZI04_ORYSJ|nr:hypothetical protein [Oryza sativa Japonica Group]